uniref:Uncharacterized protein n=1 Tax=Arundo donax TaxID=35708 RepID=A0A0A9G0J4_ARUDO
MLASLFSNL